MEDRVDTTNARIRAMQQGLHSDGRMRHETQYYNVTWHVKQKAWRVRVFFQGKAFYREFPLAQEEEAAWVADCVGFMMKGRQALEYPTMMRPTNKKPLNFDWSNGIPPCPNNTYSIYDVYGWIVQRNLPVRLKPSTVSATGYHQSGCTEKKSL